ncbi:reverse transcriptase domain-containing protein [Tanacetum coccineum]
MLAKYEIELGAYNITYVPQNAIKGQVLTEFLNETPVGTRNMEICTLIDEETSMEEWTLFKDGASSLEGVGAGLMLIDPFEVEYTNANRLNFPITNNEAEYEALLAGLYIAQNMKVQALKNSPDEDKLARYGGMNVVQKIMEIYTLIDEEAGMEEWTLYIDKASSLKVVGAGLMLIDPSEVEYTYAIRLNFPSTNNEADCEALLAGLRISQNMKVQELKVKVDSKLAACQLNVEFVSSSEGMTKFGLPRVIVTDNGTQLINDPFKSWRERFKIKQMNTVVAHPQANGLVERANKSLMHRLKARLGRERVGWVDELSNILWAHQTMLKTSNGETPFSLTYGSEAVIPVEIGMPTYWTLLFNEA